METCRIVTYRQAGHLSARARAAKTSEFIMAGDDYISHWNREFDTMWEMNDGNEVAKYFREIYERDPELRDRCAKSRFFCAAMVTGIHGKDDPPPPVGTINVEIDHGSQTDLFGGTPQPVAIKRSCNIIRPTLDDYARDNRVPLYTNEITENELLNGGKP
jgi:hypothetical protein